MMGMTGLRIHKNRVIRWKWIWLLFFCVVLQPRADVQAEAVLEEKEILVAASNGEQRTEDVYDTIYDSIPLDEVEEILQELKADEIDFSVREYVDQVLQGNAELSLAGIGEYVRQYLSEQLEHNKTTFIRLLLYGILSGVFINFSTSLYEKQMGDTGFQIIYFLVASVLFAGFFSAFAVAGEVLKNIVDFMRALVPTFSVALTWSSGSATSIAFFYFFSQVCATPF